MSSYKLTYFNWTGIGEISRLIFSLAEVPFEDFRIERDEVHFPLLTPEWKAKLPWEQVPILEVDGHTIAQSAAINRFLARRFNLYGKNEFEWAKGDELVDSIQDYVKEFMSIAMEFDPAKKPAVKQKVLEVTNPKFLSKFNQILENNGGKFLVGDNFTWADVYLCHLIPYSEHFFELKLTKDYPLIQNLIDRFYADPRIKKWRASAPEVPSFTAEEMAELMKKKMMAAQQ